MQGEGVWWCAGHGPLAPFIAIGSLPNSQCYVQVQDALAPENQPDYTQLRNETYLMQSFEKLVSDLEAPLGVSLLQMSLSLHASVALIACVFSVMFGLAQWNPVHHRWMGIAAPLG